MPEGTDEHRAVVDVHEPTEVKAKVYAHQDVDDWLEIDLSSADLIVNGVGFERKTPADFASSMTEDRLDQQVRKLADAYDRAYILIEGSLDDFADLSHTRLKPTSAYGKAASVTVRHGIPVIPTGGDPGTGTAKALLVDYAVRIGRKAVEQPSSAFIPSPDVGEDFPLGTRLWACYDGVGPARAQDLYERFGSPPDLVSDADPGSYAEMLTTVDGIGQKTAESISEGLPDE